MHELLGKVTQDSLDLRSLKAPNERQFNSHIDRIINPLINLPESQADDNQAKIAESLHEGFWANKENRRSRLEQRYHELSKPEDLIVMICCKKFCGFLELWLRSCDQNTISVREKTLVFTLDEEADRKIRAMGFKTYFFDPNIYQQAGGALNYGDRAFRRTMFYKNAAIFESLKLGGNILFQDADLIWLKDPFYYLKVQNPDSQIQIMYDGKNPRHFPYYANTGFFYVKNEPVCHAIFETALRNSTAIFKLAGHQPPFNRICHHYAVHNLLDLTVLPETLFLNGHLFNTNKGIDHSAEGWETNGIVVHYSWTGNCADKIKKLEKFNYFNIDYPSHFGIA